MAELKRSFRLLDGIAMVLGIMIGSGIFRTPGGVAAALGRPWLTFVAWTLGGVVAFAGALIFAELGTRHPRAGGKYVYVREAFGPRAGMVIGVVEVLVYVTAMAALAVVVGEYAARLAGWSGDAIRVTGAGALAFFVAINLLGAASGRLFQNAATSLKVAALLGVIVVAFAGGSGAGWSTELATAPAGTAALVALATTFQAVIFTYYGYPDVAKIAEEVVEPNRTLPRVLLISIAATTALYLLVNAAFLHVLPIDQIAASKLVAGDVATVVFGARGGDLIAVIALVVVLASVNGNVFVTPRVVFAMARDGLGPPVLARVSAGGTPWAATLIVGALSILLAATGTFEMLLGLAVALVVAIDAVTAAAMIRLRRRPTGDPSPKDSPILASRGRAIDRSSSGHGHAPFRAPAFPVLPIAFIAVYIALVVAMLAADPMLGVWSAVAIAIAVALSVLAI